jgi:hypothetical protein
MEGQGFRETEEERRHWGKTVRELKGGIRKRRRERGGMMMAVEGRKMEEEGGRKKLEAGRRRGRRPEERKGKRKKGAGGPNGRREKGREMREEGCGRWDVRGWRLEMGDQGGG